MITNGLTTQTGTYTGTTTKTTRSTVATKAKGTTAAGKTTSVEANLSTRAKKFLDELRSVNDDFDFIIAGADDDKLALVDGSKKEFSVVLSPEEMERMANDEKYAQDKLNTIRTVVEMSNRINEQFGFNSAFNDGDDGNTSTVMSKFSASINDDGSLTLFADLEKISAKQKERIEEAKEKAAEEKAKEKKLEKEEAASVKEIRITASSEAELMKKISKIDWNSIPEEVPALGTRFDMNI